MRILAAQPDTLLANIAEGSGEELPAIMGLGTMQTKRAIQLLENGKEKIISPDDRAYKVSVGSDAKVINLGKAPSGHFGHSLP